MTAAGGATSPLSFLLLQTVCGIAISLPNIYLMLGEEFGWRAYLQQKLMPLGGRKAVLLVGIIWAVWHWPAICLGLNYLRGYWGAPVVGPLLWVWSLLPVSVLYGWLTLRSGSVWPAAIAHGVNNACCGLALWFPPRAAGYIGARADRPSGGGDYRIAGLFPDCPAHLFGPRRPGSDGALAAGERRRGPA